jgi:RNA polymerase sigma-70 factor (ECF subfamily)
MSERARLLTQHIPRLRRYARALTGDADRADDLVQDSLERAWSRMHLWHGEGDMRAWLFTIMHNVFANSARKYSREPVYVSVSEDDRTTSPMDDDNESELRMRELQLALESLPEAQREVLLLVGLEQLSYEETAAILDIPIGTVMSRLSRARERLRSTLHEPGPRRRHLRSVK